MSNTQTQTPATPAAETAPADAGTAQTTTPETTATTETTTTETAAAAPVAAGTEFNAEQQAKVQELIDAAVGRTHAKFGDYDELKTTAGRVSDLETANTTLTAALADARTVAAIREAAIVAGAVSIDDVLTLMDRSTVAIDENGVVSGAAEAVAACLEAKPYLKATAAPAAPAAPVIEPIPGTTSTEGGADELMSLDDVKSWAGKPKELAKDAELFAKFKRSVAHYQDAGQI